MQTAKETEAGFGSDIVTLAHGDFHLGQVHLHDGRAWILDLDPLTNADPALDLAEVFAFLKRTARKKRLADYIAELRDALLAEYFSNMPWEIATRVPLYEALLHVRRACKCFRVQDEEDWQEEIPLLVQQAVSCMRAMQPVEKIVDMTGMVDLYERCPGAV